MRPSVMPLLGALLFGLVGLGLVLLAAQRQQATMVAEPQADECLGDVDWDFRTQRPVCVPKFSARADTQEYYFEAVSDTVCIWERCAFPNWRAVPCIPLDSAE